MQQERDVVFFDREVLLVNVGGKRQRIELRGLQQRPGGIVDELAVFQVAGVGNFRNGLAIRVFHHGVVELAAHHEVDVRAGEQAFRGLDLHLRADEANLRPGLSLLHAAHHAQVAFKANGGGEENHELVILGDLDGFCAT